MMFSQCCIKVQLSCLLLLYFTQLIFMLLSCTAICIHEDVVVMVDHHDDEYEFMIFPLTVFS